ENRKEASAVSQEEKEAYEAGIVDDEQQVEFGRADAADYTCYVSIVDVFGAYNITCKFQHFASGQLISAFSETARSGSDLADAAKTIARKIARGSDFTSGPKPKWVKAPECYYDEYTGKYVNCDISISDEGVLSYSDALNVCAKKGEGWRLPNKEELIRIFIFRNEIEQENGCVPFKKNDYWSSSKRNNYESYVVNFGNGKEAYYSKNIKNPCRCIRYE
ncbi:MAG: DUF1566 domain-containing protein, partial [Prevotellaceae bacterium]|nr:DUF1566 domain-containing protein [Prevotellaceae bacterium]